jgi:hypothetical protein
VTRTERIDGQRRAHSILTGLRHMANAEARTASSAGVQLRGVLEYARADAPPPMPDLQGRLLAARRPLPCSLPRLFSGEAAAVHGIRSD